MQDLKSQSIVGLTWRCNRVSAQQNPTDINAPSTFKSFSCLYLEHEVHEDKLE
jgi:hypothetical protein